MCEDGTVESLAQERDRLLQRSAASVGLTFSAVSFSIFLVPEVVPPQKLVVIIPLFIGLVASQFFVARNRWLPTIIGGFVAGLGIIVTAQLPLGSQLSETAIAALVPLAAGSLSAYAMVLMNSRARIMLLSLGFAGTLLAIAPAAQAHPSSVFRVWLIVALGWALVTIFAFWLNASVPRAARHIYSIGRAHQAERRASETEAQRRQSARLMHDTVLATLTLLAHSGVGVAPESMRQQAADDARLLRQLRLGGMPKPTASGDYNLEPVEESALGTTLQSVKQRFGRMGLEVSWHGTGQVLLPSDVLDAFLLALAECLENVRRHSGVTDAHVTITDDETTVRAMVTDSGVGFDIKDIDEARLGLKDSVVGRLKEVGGSARLFSAAGAGTTVVLEVPRA